MYLLDTNVISEIRKAGTGKANPNVITWAQSVSSDNLYVSVITIMEIEMGVLSIERKDAVQGKILRHWLDHNVLQTFEKRILSVDMVVAQCCARLHIPDRKSERDALIAATAITHGMTVVTRNIDDFKTTGVVILNPFD